MFELLIGIVTAVLFSCLFLWAYRRGLNDGLALKDNKPIEPIKTPVQVIHEATQAKEATVEERTQAQFMENLLRYSGEPQKEVNK
jgi:hypothetical protein